LIGDEDELLRADIQEEMGRLMIGGNPDEVLAAAKRVHADSTNLAFLRTQLEDLVLNGTQSDAFRIGVQRVAESPLDQFSIHPIMDLHMGNYYLLFPNPSLSMLIALGLFLILIFIGVKRKVCKKNKLV
jgi:hypothetical protein